jgi:hypothetical protein
LPVPEGGRIGCKGKGSNGARKGVVFLLLVGQQKNHDEKIFYCSESHEFSSLRKEVKEWLS